MENKKPEDYLDARLLAPYNPEKTENLIYEKWEKSGYFNPDNLVKDGICAPDAEPFTITLPPPNVTGVLHMGHALMISWQDLLIRWNRMSGKKALFLPGTDHAAIATQSKVETLLKKEQNISRHDLGREEMLKRIDAYANQSKNTIVSQVKRLGASCDWSREAFTLDADRNHAVNTVFKMMYDDGIIYRGTKVVNWDPKGQTTISDDEIVYEERKAKLYTFKYSHDFPIAISTTRPETKVGDTGVAVHPSDERYAKYIGQTFEIADFCGVPLTIKIVADENVEKDFGTGALGVTPAHSQIDEEIAHKNDLPSIQVINEYAKMMVGDERILNKKTTDAREEIVKWLRENDLLINEEDVSQNISTAERTGGIVEPLPKLQWFVNVNKEFVLKHSKINGIESGSKTTLKEIMKKSVSGGQIEIIPENYERVYFNWIDNLKDWCISRQIWYGHRIPVWEDSSGNEFTQITKNIYFIRHGESMGNQLGNYDGGDIDSQLTDLGREQAQEASSQIKKCNITRIISSDMVRARETAQIIAKAIGIKNVSIYPELKEVSTGNLTGKPLIKGYTALEASLEHNGENSDELLHRAKKSWDIIENTEDENILVVGHGSFSCVMRAYKDNVKFNNQELINYRRKYLVKNGDIIKMTMSVDPKVDNLAQDPDTLDTWFSSGLWTFSTLGYPNDTADLKTFHPTSIIQPGYEILFFWVARMILMSGYALGDIPFKKVLLNGIVRDTQGRKMSKSLGNSPDPIEIAQKYGADAIRFYYYITCLPGMDTKMYEDKIKGYKHFSNKIWNITRFILTQTDGKLVNNAPDIIDESDEKLITEFKTVVSETKSEMDKLHFHLAADKLYQYIWSRFADQVLEESKIIFTGEDLSKIESRKYALCYILKDTLKILHPFMPYVTEELWNILGEEGLLMIQRLPE